MSRRRILSLVVLLLVAAAIIVAAVRSQKMEPTVKRNPAVINNTKSLEAISVVRNGGEIYLALRNDYGKTVTAFAVSIGNFRFTEEFVYSDANEIGIMPQKTYERRFPIPVSIQNSSVQPIDVQAVVLEDGTGDGDSVVVNDIKDERLGERIQIERALKVLENYLALTSSNINGRVGEMKSQIVSQLNSSEAANVVALRELQPGKQTSTLSEQVKGGLGTGKEKVLRKLEDFESAQNPREEMLKVREQYQRVLRRL